MTNIKEDLENEVALSDKAEEKAIADHAALEAEVTKQTDQYDKFIIELDGMIADENKDIDTSPATRPTRRKSSRLWKSTCSRSSRTASGSRAPSTSAPRSARRRRRVSARRWPCSLVRTTSSRRRETSASFAGCSEHSARRSIA